MKTTGKTILILVCLFLAQFIISPVLAGDHIICPNCGHEVSATDVYCPYCGYRLQYQPPDSGSTTSSESSWWSGIPVAIVVLFAIGLSISVIWFIVRRTEDGEGSTGRSYGGGSSSSDHISSTKSRLGGSGRELHDHESISLGGIGIEGEFTDFSGHLDVTYDKYGTIRDRTGNERARVENTGTIRDRWGDALGSVDKSGTYRDRSGDVTGTMDKWGTYRDRSGDVQGTVDKYGTIRDREGHYVGKVKER